MVRSIGKVYREYRNGLSNSLNLLIELSRYLDFVSPFTEVYQLRLVKIDVRK